MKTFILIVSIAIFFTNCNAPYYASVNDMRGQPASLTLTNGTMLNGKINARLLGSYYTANRIAFAEGTSKEYVNYTLADIKSMYINGGTYFVKTIVGNAVNRDVQKFVKEISVPGSRISLFEIELVTKNNTNNTNDVKTQFFIQLPNANNNEIFDVASSKFTPKFDEKMSSYVQDCPALVEKIQSKSKDYFYPFLLSDNSPRRKAVLLQIINEYNNCK